MINGIKEFLGRIGRVFERSDLEGMAIGQVEEIARDVGVAADDLYRLDRSGPGNPVLLPRRLEQEGISPVVVQAEWPSVWKDLRRVCSVCASKDVCEHDLENAPDEPDWRRYCPNEHTIRSLDSQRS